MKSDKITCGFCPFTCSNCIYPSLHTLSLAAIHLQLDAVSPATAPSRNFAEVLCFELRKCRLALFFNCDNVIKSPHPNCPLELCYLWWSSKELQTSISFPEDPDTYWHFSPFACQYAEDRTQILWQSFVSSDSVTKSFGMIYVRVISFCPPSHGQTHVCFLEQVSWYVPHFDHFAYGWMSWTLYTITWHNFTFKLRKTITYTNSAQGSCSRKKFKHLVANCDTFT